MSFLGRRGYDELNDNKYAEDLGLNDLFYDENEADLILNYSRGEELPPPPPKRPRIALPDAIPDALPNADMDVVNHNQIPNMAAAQSNYDQFLAYKRAKHNALTQIAAERKALYAAARPRPARRLAFADGSSGWGKYRRNRRLGRRRPLRRTARRRGRGGYWDDAFGWIGKKLGGSEQSGKAAGQSVWNTLTGMVPGGRALSQAMGYGAYTNQAMQGPPMSVDQGVPMINNPDGPDGAVTIRHREYICDIKSFGSAFAMVNANGFSLNPGLSATFPWLSAIADGFTQYRFDGLIFHFVSTSGALSTSQALGEIIMCVNYDIAESAFTNKQQMLNEVMSVSKVPSVDCECPVECLPSQSTSNGFLFIRNQTNVSSNTQDKRFYDLGNFYVATQGQTVADPVAGVALGELWVTYQVSLFKPQLQNNINALGAHFYTNNYGGASGPLLNAAAVYNALNISISPSGDAIRLPANTPPGKYMAYCTWYSDDPAECKTPTLTLSSGLSNLSILDGGADGYQAAPSALGGTSPTCKRLSLFITFNVTHLILQNYETLTFSNNGVYPAGPSNKALDILVMPLPSTTL